MKLQTRELLDKVKAAEEELEKINKDPWRLKFHLMPPVGWINDPNGLCQMNGIYHVFFQYSPLEAAGGIKFWGHYTSSDLLEWNYEGVTLVPDQEFDRDGIYSGSSFIENDQMHIFYTGNVKEEGDHDYVRKGRGAATIYVKYQENTVLISKAPVLRNEDYPEHYSCHIRDPKVWKEDNQYFMVLGGRTLDDEGRVLVYTSKDLKQWKLCNELKTKETFGYMWECPDLFEIDGQNLLSISPQGLIRENFRFQNIYQSGYFYLDGDFRSDYQLRDFEEWDYGFDFYAPQTFLDEKGRRIIIGWMGMSDSDLEYQNPTIENGWQHALTMLREISMKDGQIFQTPVKEYLELRDELIEVENKTKIRNLETFELEVKQGGIEDLEFIFSEGLVLKYNVQEELFSMEFINELGAGRTIRKVKIKSLKSLHMFVDTSSIELFLNDGEKVLTTRYYNSSTENTIQFVAGTAEINIWKMKNMTVNY
ncbi:glycoside hydrolase family 32 protein [Anaerosacchariphilus polymeriproducens]|uniref:Sucrose-6-phosphate hydrolase n=1 Tax=Anaerosacchariphilus polymeriproducens TaxID=1812858 RepID=A0A371ATM2_9FIRM|nr:glycoside hydrolase family 32 protein [Anaerosacchariphilus polymeriproducens]RDU22917.1 glycosyl hydrolase family 32 [Anaerosacchariphilus polymeriproducens]